MVVETYITFKRLYSELRAFGDYYNKQIFTPHKNYNIRL